MDPLSDTTEAANAESSTPAQDRKTLHEKVCKALSGRNNWAQKQVNYYQMRRDGLPRLGKPYPNAADLHDALIDDVITGKHPFFAGQLFGAERIATFAPAEDVGLPAQSEMANTLAEWFDDALKNNTNLFARIIEANDSMMQSGRGILFPYWSEEKSKLCFESVDPMAFVVPKHTKDMQDAAWVCRVVTMSCDSFRANPAYKKEALPLVKGAGGSDAMAQLAKNTRDIREGLTHVSDDDVVLWEVYTKEKDAAGNITVKMQTISPVSPDTVVRDDITLPDFHEVQDDGTKVTHYPFVDLPNEVVEPGWYSSRGDAEKLAAYEAWACKMWNRKADFLDFAGSPMFTGGREGNLATPKFIPGQILEGDLEQVEIKGPPFELDDERMRTRSLAEQRAKLPDFGIGARNNLKANKTATEVNALTTFATTGVEMLANIYRLRITNLLAMSWAITLQHAPGKLAKIFGGDSVDAAKIIRAFRVSVSGSVDSWNKAVQHERATFFWSAFKNDPMVNQFELRKLMIESVDPRLTKRLLVDPKIHATDEAEDEAMEIVLMLEGFPAQPMPGEDHAGRVLLIVQKMQEQTLITAQEEDGDPEEPIEMQLKKRSIQLLTQHMKQHLELLKQEQPQKLPELMQEIGQIQQQTQAMVANIQHQKAMEKARGPVPFQQPPPQPPPGGPAPMGAEMGGLS